MNNTIEQTVNKNRNLENKALGQVANQNTIEQTNEITQNELTTEKEQNGFLSSRLGKIVNTAVDLGLRWILPDFVENQIIDVKNSLLKGGLKAGIDKAVESGIELGKSVTGIFTGKFDNISQAQNAIKNGGIIDGISDVIDTALNTTTKNGWIPTNVASLIRQGKNVILDNVSNNIETEFVSQLDNVEKLGKYENNWRSYYKNQDFDGMEREYQKIRERLKELMPIESTLKEAREIENIHLLIKNNGHNFNLSNEQLQLAGMLTA